MQDELMLKVESISEAAAGVFVLRLVDPSGAALPAWTPGAHIDLVLPGDVVRQYSLCGDPWDRSYYRVGVLNEVNGRGGSHYICTQMKAGDMVPFRGPRNHFELLPSPSYIFIAGGIGVTPILAMANEATRRGAEWTMLYGGRTRTSMAFLDELVLHQEKLTVSPQDEAGLLDLAAWVSVPKLDTMVYCCGPEPLLNAVEKACAAWPHGALSVERFVAKELTAPVLAGSFQIELARSGLTLTVPPDKSILAVLKEVNINVLTSCGSGTCGSCETKVLAGIPDHRDTVLDDDEQAENNVMMVCVSRSISPKLTLDL